MATYHMAVRPLRTSKACRRCVLTNRRDSHHKPGNEHCRCEWTGTSWIVIRSLCGRAGLAALASRRAAMANVYDALAIGGFLRASGITSASYSLTRSDTAYEETWTLP